MQKDKNKMKKPMQVHELHHEYKMERCALGRFFCAERVFFAAGEGLVVEAHLAAAVVGIAGKEPEALGGAAAV